MTRGGGLPVVQDLGDTRSIAPNVSDTANPRDAMSSLPFEQLLANIQAI